MPSPSSRDDAGQYATHVPIPPSPSTSPPTARLAYFTDGDTSRTWEGDVTLPGGGVDSSWAFRARMGPVAGVGIMEERRRRRRAGDPRLSDEGRAILARIADGDLADEFQAALDVDLVADPLLGGHDDDDA